jgi:hypothetical protein
MDFQVNDIVTWTVKHRGVDLTKRGTIIQVVPPGEYPTGPEHLPLANMFGMTRKIESYLIRADGMAYWPMPKRLAKIVESKEVARVLSNFVNGIGNKVEDVVAHLAQDHRTLQQGITKFCVAWLEECDRKHKVVDYDLRNEASAELGMYFVSRISPKERAMPFI